jgi:hypothetical protein
VDLATASPAVPVIGIVRPQTLDELSDVETLSPLPVGSVLFVDGDGVWRPHLLSTTDITRDEVVASDAWLRNRAADLDALMVGGAITRNSSGAATGAPVIWPDGTPGSYTALVLSVDFPGAVDSYEVTYGSPVAKTVTQPTVTRDASGAITTRPALTVA